MTHEEREVLDAAYYQIRRLCADTECLRAEVAALRALLREVEWAGDECACVICGRLRIGGHRPDCRLGAALAE
jgi:hypothetical protein